MKDQFVQWVAKKVMANVAYAEQRDILFTSGEAHSDIHAVFPSPLEQEIAQTYCNYIECTQQPPDPHVSGSQVLCYHLFTFNLHDPETQGCVLSDICVALSLS